MLKLQFKDRRRESVWLVDSRFTIGKANNNSLMIDDNSVDTMHAEIVNQQDQLILHKKSLKGSLKVNGLEITASTPLKANDSISIGSIELQLIDSQSLVSNPAKQAPWSLHSNASWLEQQDYIIDRKMLIGRDASCDICLSLDYLSRKHISLEPVNGKLLIEDLNSSNGTFVNGQRIQKTELKPGDKIKLDVLTFEVRGPSASSAHDPHKTIIRSIPNPQAASKTASGASTTAANNSASKTNPPKQSAAADLSSTRTKADAATAKEKVLARKRLAAEGKQVWISGDNQLKPKPEKSKKGRGLFITVAILLIIATGLIYALSL